MSNISIPMDVYESPREIVIIMPLGWVDKKSIELYFDDFKLHVTGTRVQPLLKEDLTIQQDECYWGGFEQVIHLPPYVYFDRIHSEVTPENILIITVPKALQPWKTKIDVVVAQARTTKVQISDKKTPSTPKSTPRKNATKLAISRTKK